MDVLATELSRPDRWPVFPVPLANGHTFHLVWRNYEGDAGFDYAMALDGHSSVVTLASIEGHFMGPALSWPELLNAAGQPDDRRSAAQRLLLLLPAMGDTRLPTDAVHTVVDALTAVGAQRQQRVVAEELLDGRSDADWAEWAVLSGVPVGIGRYSLRGPSRQAAELQAIAAALGG